MRSEPTTVPNPLTDPTLAELVRRLVAAYEPEAVYLFGSRARGQPGPDSDYDLLVVVPDNAAPERKRSRLAYEVRTSSAAAWIPSQKKSASRASALGAGARWSRSPTVPGSSAAPAAARQDRSEGGGVALGVLLGLGVTALLESLGTPSGGDMAAERARRLRAGREALAGLQRQAKARGLDKMTDEDIDAVIKASRRDRRARRKP
jgi:hypothetical protein